ncbi:hypothetical protein Tco_0674900 [Tanacetum coccineum]
MSVLAPFHILFLLWPQFFALFSIPLSVLSGLPSFLSFSEYPVEVVVIPAIAPKIALDFSRDAEASIVAPPSPEYVPPSPDYFPRSDLEADPEESP